MLFLVDAIRGVTPADREVANILRRSQKMHRRANPGRRSSWWPTRPTAPTQRADSVEFYELGMGDPYPISAVHGTGTGDLLDELVASFPKQEEESRRRVRSRSPSWASPTWASPACSTAGGRRTGHRQPHPRHHAGCDRHQAGVDGLPVTLIDTAGIRRRGKIDRGVEKYSVVRSMRAIERGDVALLVIDATSGITAQDAHIAGFHPGSLEERGGGGEQMGRRDQR